MKTLTATYRIVTPMFLGGVEPASQAELRVPSIKGALRFWWRALMWGKIRSIDELRRKEADLFGSTDTGQSRLLLSSDKALVERNTVQGEKWAPASWQTYTGYGLRDKMERRFLSPGQDFRLHLDLRRCTPEQRQEVLAAIQLFGLAGGLGARSRRGWGSVTLVKLEGAPWNCPNTGGEWMKAMESLVKERSPALPPYSAFSNHTAWNCGPVKEEAASAQAWLGRQYQAHVKSTLPKALRAQFGLPREFKKPTPPRRQRRASPLLLHVHQCPNGKALPIALWIPATFLSKEPAIPGNGDSALKFVQNLSAEQ